MQVFIDFLQTELSKKKFGVRGCFFFVILMILHFFTLKSTKLRELHWWRLLRSSWNKLWSEAESMILVLLQSSAYRAMVFPGSTTSGRSLMNMAKNSGPKREPCGTSEELLTKMKKLRPAPLLVADGLDSFRTIVQEGQRYRNHRASAIKLGD